MRSFLLVLVSALIVPLAAYAQVPKQVEVINDPLAVEVINPAPPGPPVRWQLVGFTSATYTGAMGGHFGVTQKCQTEFPNSRMCRIEEVAATTSIPSPLSGNAWVNFPGDYFPIYRGDCFGWNYAQLYSEGYVVASNGSIPDPVASDCTIERPIACCALVP